MDKRFLAILGVLITIFIGIFVVSQNSSDKDTSRNGSVKPTNHITGEGKKGVTLVEYGDYQCPVCALYEPTVKQVVAKYSSDIRFQFRNLPLSSIHPNAFAAARAAEAADLQGKFWQMHDLLYNQTNWQTWTNSSSPQTHFNNYAQQLSLDLNQFKTDYASSKVNALINADLAEFNKTGRQLATPAFFLDGVAIENSQVSDDNGPSIAKFSQLIDAAIAKKARQ